MTRRHQLEDHRHRLGELCNIINSMKTLAMMETRKLEKGINTRVAMSSAVERIAADLLCFYPEVIPENAPESDIVLLVGSERGFCGNFNETVAQKFQQFMSSRRPDAVTVIAIGSKLHAVLEVGKTQRTDIGGADVGEDIDRVVGQIAQSLERHRQVATLYAIYHDIDGADLHTHKLLPPFTDIAGCDSEYTLPPLLNMDSNDFFLELTDHYLYWTLNRIMYVSLMMENQRRMEHLENAKNHLDDKTEELGRKISAMRQEEIIEEIEVILLNTGVT